LNQSVARNKGSVALAFP